MPAIRVNDESDLEQLGLSLAPDGTLVRATPEDQPSEDMNDDQLVAYAARQEAEYQALACRSVMHFFRRGWALQMLFDRHPGQWKQLCHDHGIGRTWATHARHFYVHFGTEAAIPPNKTISDLLEEAGITQPVHKLNRSDDDRQASDNDDSEDDADEDDTQQARVVTSNGVRQHGRRSHSRNGRPRHAEPNFEATPHAKLAKIRESIAYWKNHELPQLDRTASSPSELKETCNACIADLVVIVNAIEHPQPTLPR